MCQVFSLSDSKRQLTAALRNPQFPDNRVSWHNYSHQDRLRSDGMAWHPFLFGRGSQFSADQRKNGRPAASGNERCGSMAFVLKRIACVMLALVVLMGSEAAVLAVDATFGPAINFPRTAGESYAGIVLTATSENNGTGGFEGYTGDIYLPDADSNLVAFPAPTSTGPTYDGFGSTVTILAGIASADTVVSVQFRKPNTNEVFGFSESPPMGNSAGYNSVLSDIVRITGINATGAPAPDGRIPTDTFVIQMTYEGGSYLEDYIFEYGDTRDMTEDDIVADAEVQIAFLNEVTGFFADDDLGNFGDGSIVVENYAGSYGQFASSHSVLETDLDNYVGSWGVDIVNDHVWAIINHTTDFTVVPEPNALALLLGLGSLIVASRRHGRP